MSRSTKATNDAKRHVVGDAVLKAFRIATAAGAHDGFQEIVEWAARLSLEHSHKDEHIVVCEMETYATNPESAADTVATNIFKTLVAKMPLTFCVYTRDGMSQHARELKTNTNLPEFLIRNGLTVTKNGDMYAGMPTVTAVSDGARGVATLDIESLLRSLDNEQVIPHVTWRSIEDDFAEARKKT